NTRNPAPPGNEHGRIKQSLNQHGPDAGWMQVARNLGQFEAVRNGKRKHDVVFGGGRLQLEVELAAEAFAQCQTPGAVDAAAIGGMDHQLHAPGFVEESLEYERALCRHAPKSSPPAM